MDREALQNLDATSYEILAPAEGKRQRRFSMLANTGASVQRMFGKAIFDLSGIELGKKIPILADHDSTKRAGYANKAELTEEGLVLSGVLLSNETGKQIAEESDEGFPFQASIGLSVSEWLEVEEGSTHEVNGREVAGPIAVALKSRLLESSFLMAGADHNTHAIALAAAQQQKEAHMTPEAFLAANPEAVAAWQEEAAQAARTTQRADLGAYLAAFPGRESFATEHFIAGSTLLEAKAALSDVLVTELAAAKAAPAPVDPTLEALATQAPGVGFSGGDNEPGSPPAPTVETLWERPEIRSEFRHNHNAYLHMAERGLIQELNG